MCPLPFNLGVGGAMRTGYRYALRHGYDVAVQIDADGQHDPRFLAPLLARLDSADVVIGARFAKPDDPYKVRGPRRWAMVLLASVLSRLAHTRLTDVTSGLPRLQPSRDLGLRHPLPRRVPRRHRRVAGHRRPRRAAPSPRSRSPCGRGWPDRLALPVKAAIYLFRAVVALILALVRDWPSQLEDGATRARRVDPRRHRREEARDERVTILGIAGSIIILLALFEMMRRHRLREKYALIWALVALAIITVAAFPAS